MSYSQMLFLHLTIFILPKTSCHRLGKYRSELCYLLSFSHLVYLCREMLVEKYMEVKIFVYGFYCYGF